MPFGDIISQAPQNAEMAVADKGIDHPEKLCIHNIHLSIKIVPVDLPCACRREDRILKL